MESTTKGEGATRARGGSGEPPAADAAERLQDARARARAYLDLWEEHVVQTALYGPVSTWPPGKS